MIKKLTHGEATRVVDCIGGRMVYLQSFLKLSEMNLNGDICAFFKDVEWSEGPCIHLQAR